MAEKEEQKIKYRIHPRRFFDYDTDEKTWSLEVQLPGVEKGSIIFKALNNTYFLEARRDAALYTLNESLPFEMEKDSIQAEYKDGLLNISGKIKDPLAEAVDIILA